MASNEKSQVEFAQAIANLRDNLPAMMEFQRLNAKVIRAKYVALIGEGFSEQQALQLCGGEHGTG
jgi:DNA topoisomerase IB